jgi:hypothetical protein
MLSDDSTTPSESTEASADAAHGEPQETFIRVADDQPDYWQGYGTETTTLDDAIAHVHEQAGADGERTDLKVEDLDRWVFGLLDGVAFVADPNAKRGFPLRHTAFAHLCARAKAPPSYLRSVPTRYALPALNWGLRMRSEGQAMIRLAGGEARAIVSQRYTAFDDVTTLPALRGALDAANLLGNAAARVVATGLTTVVRVGLAGDAIAIPGTDEIAEVALDYSNGEVGNRAVHLSPSVYLRHRGLSTRRSGLRVRHMGDPERLVEDFRSALPATLAEARRLRDQIIKAVDKAIADVLDETEKLRNLGLSVSEARDVLRGVAANSGVMLPHDTAEWEGPIQELANIRAYDMFSAVIAASEGRGVDRRLELEEVAAKYLAKATK